MPQTTIRVETYPLQPLRVRCVERRCPDPDLRPESGDGLDSEVVLDERVVCAMTPEDREFFRVGAGHLNADLGNKGC